MSKRTITENTSLVLDYPSLTYEGNITFDGPVTFQHATQATELDVATINATHVNTTDLHSNTATCASIFATNVSTNSIQCASLSCTGTTATTTLNCSTINCQGGSVNLTVPIVSVNRIGADYFTCVAPSEFGEVNCGAITSTSTISGTGISSSTNKTTSLSCANTHLNNTPLGTANHDRYSDIQTATIPFGGTAVIPNTYTLKPGPALLKFGMVISDGAGNYGQYDQEYLCYTVGTTVVQTAGINQSKKEVGPQTTGKISFTLSFTGAVGQLSVVSTSAVTFQALIWATVTYGSA